MDFLLEYHGVDWVATFFNVLALYLIGKKKKIGFVMGFLATIGWMVFGIIAESAATIMANIMFLALNVKGYLEWDKS